MPGPISSAETLCLNVATALSKMEQPDLKSTDMDDLDMLAETLMDASGIARMGDAIRELSGGAVELSEADPNEFSIRIRGMASYLALVGNGKRQLLIVTKSPPPIMFVKPAT